MSPADRTYARLPSPFAWGALVAGLVGMAVYVGALGNGFVYDDVVIVVGDPRVRAFELSGLLFRGYWPTEDVLGLWRPLTSLSFAGDWALAPDNPAWFHLVNVVGHGAVSALVFVVLRMLFRQGPALLGALVFAVHPVHVEAVANVVGRAEVLAALLVLGAAALWLWTGAAGEAGMGRGGAGVGAAPERLRAPVRLGAVPALYLLALLAKESAVMLPAALVLLDAAAGRWRMRGTAAYLRRHLLPFSVLAGTLAVYLGARAWVLGGMAPVRVDPALEVTAGTLERVLTGLQAWPHWLRLHLWPRTLLADYGPRIIDPARGVTPAVLTGALIVAALLAGGGEALRRGHGRTAAALLWVPVMALPVSNLLVAIGVVVAERTLYLPSVALSLAAAGATEAVLRAGHGARRLGAVAAALVLVLLAARTAARVPVWASNGRLFSALVRDRPDSFRGHWNLARTARGEGHVELALTEYGAAVSLWPYRRGLVLEAAAFAAGSNRLDYAARLAEHAVATWPDAVDGHRILAAAALDRGDTAAATAAVRRGLAAFPADSLLLRMRAALQGGS